MNSVRTEFMVKSRCASDREKAIALMMLGEVYESILLYRGTDHGWTEDDFLSRTRGEKFTLTLLKIKNGDCIGGFTKIEWGCSSIFKKYIKDDDSFLFNLTCCRKFPSKHSNYDIIRSRHCGPSFGYKDTELSAWCEPFN